MSYLKLWYISRISQSYMELHTNNSKMLSVKPCISYSSVHIPTIFRKSLKCTVITAKIKIFLATKKKGFDISAPLTAACRNSLQLCVDHKDFSPTIKTFRKIKINKSFTILLISFSKTSKSALVRREAERLSTAASWLRDEQDTELQAAPGRICCAHLWENWETSCVEYWKDK